ncbi:uncharacterized protein LOC132937152 [Metopolophium dirhodum]|uniref:uncharacterized protein LOC132937152 n=1 Tax=Metopolophium dirhodum TaxID=44670 RepID=UPI00298FAF12|nr:uncharacterized protein LOC132937152 [Metopolophium dirhodum]
MDLMKISVVLYISLILVLNKYSDCTTHPRVKMYGPKVTVIDRRKPDPKIGQDVINEVKIISQPEDFLDEPSCLELRLMWRTYQRQNQLTQSASSLPLTFDPFAFNTWEDYIKPRYINRQKSMMFERTIPDRFHIYRQLRPFEKIARLTTTTRAIMDDQLTRKANLFRLGYHPLTKIPVIAMRLTAKDRFQELKELMRHEKTNNYQPGDSDDDPFSIVPITAAAVTSNGTAGKKRPGYESLMSRPRHFSQGHYMNMKPNGERIDSTVTVTPQYKSSPLIKPWNSRW